MEERRKEQRSRSLKTATIIFNNRFSTVSCTVRNMSEHGAKLIVGSPLGIPDHVQLTFADGSTRECKVVWRKETEIGVEFT